jgi:hypothetical protein
VAPGNGTSRYSSRARLVEASQRMTEDMGLADELVAHSEDEDEWADEPVQIESRPSGSQVISARLPTQLAEELLAAAASRGAKPSELVREAVEAWLHNVPGAVMDVRAFAGQNMHVFGSINQTGTQNLNQVVDVQAPRTIEVTEEVT